MAKNKPITKIETLSAVVALIGLTAVALLAIFDSNALPLVQYAALAGLLLVLVRTGTKLRSAVGRVERQLRVTAQSSQLSHTRLESAIGAISNELGRVIATNVKQESGIRQRLDRLAATVTNATQASEAPARSTPADSAIESYLLTRLASNGAGPMSSELLHQLRDMDAIISTLGSTACLHIPAELAPSIQYIDPTASFSLDETTAVLAWPNEGADLHQDSRLELTVVFAGEALRLAMEIDGAEEVIASEWGDALRVLALPDSHGHAI